MGYEPIEHSRLLYLAMCSVGQRMVYKDLLERQTHCHRDTTWYCARLLTLFPSRDIPVQIRAVASDEAIR